MKAMKVKRTSVVARGRMARSIVWKGSIGTSEEGICAECAEEVGRRLQEGAEGVEDCWLLSSGRQDSTGEGAVCQGQVPPCLTSQLRLALPFTSLVLRCALH